MKTLKALILKFPIISSLIALLLASYLTEIPLTGLLTDTLGYQAAFYLTVGLEQFIIALVGGLLLVKTGLLKKAGLTRPTPLRSIWLVWPILILALLNGSDLLTGAIHFDYYHSSYHWKKLNGDMAFDYLEVGPVMNFQRL
jgi:hypothetical protein